MRLLYGVVGEGMGHAMRSRVVLEHLLGEGHEVEIMASQRAVDFLQARFPEVHRIHGFRIIYEENRVRRGKTLWNNAMQGGAALPGQIAAYFRLIEDFRPEAVVSDFESWTYFYGKAHRLPIISIDNMQIINRCELPPEVLEGHRTQFEVTRAFIKSKLPFCSHYFITTFFEPPVRKERTTLVPPILRPEILAAQSRRGEHLVVYQTAEGHEELTRALAATGLECRIYGMRQHISEEQAEGTLRFRPFDEASFIEDVASARGVIAGGGFTLMSECVYLHKPVLAVPVRGQFEQVLNGRYLEHLGYGMYAPAIDAQTLESFVARLDEFSTNLSSYRQDGNRDLFEQLDSYLDRAAAGL